MGRTGKDADVEDVDVKADGEEIALPSYYPVYGDGYKDGLGEKNYGWGGHNRPCASARFQRRTLKKKTHFPSDNRHKIELKIK